MTQNPPPGGGEDAEQHKSRVQLFREESGAAGLSGRDLPTDQTLAAHASVCARAQEYKDSGAFPEDTRMDQYRAAAYLDLLERITAEARIASGQIDTVFPAVGDVDEPGQDGWEDEREPDGPGARGCACRECDGSCLPPDDEFPPEDDPERRRPRWTATRTAAAARGPDGRGRRGPGGDDPRGNPVPPAAPTSPPRLADLVLPLATLLGLAERPGEGYGLGPLDPDLCRELAAAAAGSPWTRLCVTVTDADGIAIGHGCAKPPRRPRAKAKPTTADQTEQPDRPAPGARPCRVPARANLTITAARLAELAGTGPPGTPGPPRTPDRPEPPARRATGAPWSLTRADGPGPPDGFGSWTLTLPDGRNLTVELEPVPTFDCDHRHESHAYQPNDTLRHLVQVRDGAARSRPAHGTRGRAISSMRRRTTRADGPARVMQARAAARATR